MANPLTPKLAYLAALDDSAIAGRKAQDAFDAGKDEDECNRIFSVWIAHCRFYRGTNGEIPMLLGKAS
jgi:hypothetical protein